MEVTVFHICVKRHDYLNLKVFKSRLVYHLFDKMEELSDDSDRIFLNEKHFLVIM